MNVNGFSDKLCLKQGMKQSGMFEKQKIIEIRLRRLIE
jgi:hypothetical protein